MVFALEPLLIVEVGVVIVGIVCPSGSCSFARENVLVVNLILVLALVEDVIVLLLTFILLHELPCSIFFCC